MGLLHQAIAPSLMGMQKNIAERTKTAEQHSCEGYSVAYAGTQGTVFVRSLTAFNRRKSANLQIFSKIINFDTD